LRAQRRHQLERCCTRFHAEFETWRSSSIMRRHVPLGRPAWCRQSAAGRLMVARRTREWFKLVLWRIGSSCSRFFVIAEVTGDCPVLYASLPRWWRAQFTEYEVIMLNIKLYCIPCFNCLSKILAYSSTLINNGLCLLNKQKRLYYAVYFKKTSSLSLPYIFSNNSVKRPILIIFWYTTSWINLTPGGGAMCLSQLQILVALPLEVQNWYFN